MLPGYHPYQARAPSRRCSSSCYLVITPTRLGHLRGGAAHHVTWLSPLPGSGTFEAVQLITASYPTRIPYADIHGRYKEHMPDFVQVIYIYIHIYELKYTVYI